MLSTEIHVPISPTPAFANQLFFLVHSISRNARLPGPWRLIATLSRDGTLDARSPEFAWARDFPVTFRTVDEGLWNRFYAESRERKWPTHEYSATALQVQGYDFESDAVIFMDADTLVLGPLGEIVERAHEKDCLLAKPAYMPPPNIDLDALIGLRGLSHGGPSITYEGYGWDFLEPRFGPPYFNYGFLVCSNRVGRMLAECLPRELDFVWNRKFTKFDWQIALCLAIVGQRIGFEALSMRFNFGNGSSRPPLLGGEEGKRLVRDLLAEAGDIRLLHYCVPSPHFDRAATMGDPAELARFCRSANVADGTAILQQGLLAHFEDFRRHAKINLGLDL